MSLGELIRVSLDATVQAVSYDSDADPLFENAVFDGPAPADLSRNHDRHLYDERE